MSSPKTVSGRTSPHLLAKADRLFRNDDASVWVEILQNARRANATLVDITIEEHPSQQSTPIVTVHDNGHGIGNFQDLLTLGESGWNESTEAREDPAGMGFFALCRSEVTVESGKHSVTITPPVFLGQSEAKVVPLPQPVQGTRIRFTRDSTKQQLIHALERVTEFYTVEVRLDGKPLPRHDFLEGSLYREEIDGIEVGFAPQFRWGHRSYPDENWNFYGARIRGAELAFTGLLRPDRVQPYTVYARFNVLDTARVKLQLPDRKSIIEDRFSEEFLLKARAAAYRLFLMEGKHALPFKYWKEANALGITLPEAACLLSNWHAKPADDNAEPTFGSCGLKVLTDVSRVILVDRNLENRHTFEAAIECGAAVDGDLYFEEPEFTGYSWYDNRPRIVDTEIFLDGIAFDRKTHSANRPKKIEVEVAIEQANTPERRIRFSTPVHVESDSSIWFDFCFIAVENSPWDNADLTGPFPIVDFIIGATFCPSDDADADSWETQSDRYEEEVRREANAYFRGPKATLLAILKDALDYRACTLAEELDVHEIRFTRAEGAQSWSINLGCQETA